MAGSIFRYRLRHYFSGLSSLSRGLRLLFSKRSYLVQVGYMRSAGQREPRSVDGEPLPWMNYGIIHFLDQRLTPELNLFEYGSGFSTIFYSGRVGKVTSVEHSPGWHQKVLGMVPENADVWLRELAPDATKYINAAREGGEKYDLVVVDGRERVACAAVAVDVLSDRGVILLDDSSRGRYEAGIARLRSLGFRQLDFVGLKPAGLQGHQSSLFYRDNNCLGL